MKEEREISGFNCAAAPAVRDKIIFLVMSLLLLSLMLLPLVIFFFLVLNCKKI